MHNENLSEIIIIIKNLLKHKIRFYKIDFSSLFCEYDVANV